LKLWGKRSRKRRRKKKKIVVMLSSLKGEWRNSIKYIQALVIWKH